MGVGLARFILFLSEKEVFIGLFFGYRGVRV